MHKWVKGLKQHRRVNLVTNPVISQERGNDREVLTTSGTHQCSFATQIFHSGQPNQDYFNLTNIYILHMQVLLECCYI
jgi:hypothetical protein